MREFFQALWPTAPFSDRDTWTCLWFQPVERAKWFRIADLGGLDDSDVEKAASVNQHVYFPLGARDADLGDFKYGGKDHVVALPAVALDIDFFNPDFPDAHKATNLPRSLDEAAEVILDGLPDPSIVVSTGNGAHLYWCFSAPVLLLDQQARKEANKQIKAFQSPLIEKAKSAGWQLDRTSGIQRIWRVPGFTNLKTGLPVELLHVSSSTRYAPEDLGFKRPKASKQKTSTAEPVASSDEELVVNLRAAIKRLAPGHEWEDAFMALLAGESMAPAGERDNTLQGVCSTIAWLEVARGATPVALAEVLRPSLAVWANEEGADKTLEEEIEKAIDKLERAQVDWQNYQERLKQELAPIAKSLDKAMAEVTLDYLKSHAIIQHRTSHYVWDFRTGGYSSAKIQTEVVTFARDAWKDGPRAMDVTYVNTKGETKVKTLPTLLSEYAINADKVIGDLSIEESWFDADKLVFHEACLPRRVTEPEYNRQIATWLELMTGKSVEKVLDWLAALTRLDRQCCALYLSGVSGAGKGLLANGLARLWHKGSPTPFESVTKGDFNSELIQCPLVWIDEGVSAFRTDFTVELRALVGRQSFFLNDKYVSSRPIQGAVRLMICANNDNVFNVGVSELGAEDLEAVVGRILHVHACREGAEWLEAHNEDGKLTEQWVEGDAIAKHVLWLAENREIKPGKRFLVEGDETALHRNLIMRGETSGLIYEWAVRFATNPQLLYARYRTKSETCRALIGDDQILINTQAIVDCWDAYMQSVRRPATGRIGRFCTKLSSGKRRLGPRKDRVVYHRINPELVLEWCRQNQVGNEEKIVEHLKTPMKDVSGE